MLLIVVDFSRNLIWAIENMFTICFTVLHEGCLAIKLFIQKLTDVSWCSTAFVQAMTLALELSYPYLQWCSFPIFNLFMAFAPWSLCFARCWFRFYEAFFNTYCKFQCLFLVLWHFSVWLGFLFFWTLFIPCLSGTLFPRVFENCYSCFWVLLFNFNVTNLYWLLLYAIFAEILLLWFSLVLIVLFVVLLLKSFNLKYDVINFTSLSSFELFHIEYWTLFLVDFCYYVTCHKLYFKISRI